MQKEAFNEAKVQEVARQIRIDCVEMTHRAGSAGGHLGPTFSCTEIVATLYFGGVLNYRPGEPAWMERDRFLLSKGHAVQVLYAALAEAGFFPKENMWTFEQKGSCFSGHPPAKGVPGIDFPTGSMGHGISVGVGMALGAMHAGGKQNVYVVSGDGELNEGSAWEGIMSAPKFGLDNLTVVVDNNGFQHDAETAKVMPMNDIGCKFEAFGWEVLRVDGHDVTALYEAYTAPRKTGLPRAIIAKTIKGKGVSFTENNNLWHHGHFAPGEYEKAMAELNAVEG